MMIKTTAKIRSRKRFINEPSNKQFKHFSIVFMDLINGISTHYKDCGLIQAGFDHFELPQIQFPFVMVHSLSSLVCFDQNFDLAGHFDLKIIKKTYC